MNAKKRRSYFDDAVEAQNEIAAGVDVGVGVDTHLTTHSVSRAVDLPTPKAKNLRINIVVTPADKRWVENKAAELGVKESEIWRCALQYYKRSVEA